jgi:N6-adenosine-specific RNA methylase IME4
MDQEETYTVEDIEAVIRAGKTYGTLYVDPPWAYGNQGTRAATGNHYGTLTVEQIAAVPLGEVAAEVAHLHLWTTNAFLFACPHIMAAWGFTYKSCFVWTKPQMGIGNYWRVSHEFLLLGVRGSCPFRKKSLMSWETLKRSVHSRKPEEVRRMIEQASPGPYFEAFGRRVVPGWTVWGNEIERTLFEQAVPVIGG